MVATEIRHEAPDGSGAAVVSPCFTYRYLLERRTGDGAGVVLFVMLNPSTADALSDDPTVRRCMAFARRWGFGRMHIVNLFGYRTSSPDELEAAARITDVMGPGNLAHIVHQLGFADRVICAWGNHGAKDAAGFIDLVRELASVDESLLGRLFHLGLTESGQPKHPLARGRHRIPDDVEPVPLVRPAPAGYEKYCVAGARHHVWVEAADWSSAIEVGAAIFDELAAAAGARGVIVGDAPMAVRLKTGDTTDPWEILWVGGRCECCDRMLLAGEDDYDDLVGDRDGDVLVMCRGCSDDLEADA